MKSKCKVFTVAGLIAVLVSATACGEQVASPVRETAGTFVENIYIGDTIVTEIFSDGVQNVNPVVVGVVYENDTPTNAPVTASSTEAQSVPSATQAVQTASSSELTIEQALENVKSSINDAKNAKDFSAEQTMDVSISLTDCSISALVGPLNALLDRFLGQHIYEYKFVNGECDDPREDVDKATPMYSIPPGDRLFALEPAGVAEWSMEKDGTNTTYHIKVVREETSLQDLKPKYHSQAMDYLDLTEYDFGVAKIDEAKCIYSGADITVTVNENGKLLFYREVLPMQGKGSGSLGISIDAAYEGQIDEQWKIEW